MLGPGGRGIIGKRMITPSKSGTRARSPRSSARALDSRVGQIKHEPIRRSSTLRSRMARISAPPPSAAMAGNISRNADRNRCSNDSESACVSFAGEFIRVKV